MNNGKDKVLRVLWFPSTCFTQIYDCLNDGIAVIEINAHRRMIIPDKITRTSIIKSIPDTELPFISYRSFTQKEVNINFFADYRSGVTSKVWGSFPISKFREFLNHHEIVDIQINKLILKINDEELWKEYGNMTKSYPLSNEQKALTFEFRNNSSTSKGRNDMKRKVMQFMGEERTKMHFYVESLDLTKILTYPDFKVGINNNLFGVGFPKKELKNIWSRLFKLDKMFCRCYEQMSKDRWELTEVSEE